MLCMRGVVEAIESKVVHTWLSVYLAQCVGVGDKCRLGPCGRRTGAPGWGDVGKPHYPQLDRFGKV